jgi:hypothetical protein
VAGTEDDPLYQTERWFPSDLPGSQGYRIPVPQGQYRVSLHFAEIFLRERGARVRVFDVRLEGKPVLESYEPLAAGFATAETKTFDVEVRDGFLDVEFKPRADSPKISAIAIEALR